MAIWFDIDQAKQQKAGQNGQNAEELHDFREDVRSIHGDGGLGWRRLCEGLLPIEKVMNVLMLTVLLSSLLAIFFIIAFIAEWVRGRRGSVERESLLAVEEGGRVVSGKRRGGADGVDGNE